MAAIRGRATPGKASGCIRGGNPGDPEKGLVQRTKPRKSRK